jgi:hypothetical protein
VTGLTATCNDSGSSVSLSVTFFCSVHMKHRFIQKQALSGSMFVVLVLVIQCNL